MAENKQTIYHDINRPLYLQLKDILVGQIESGELEPGHTIPGERMLAQMYDVSRVTVRKCIGNMVEEGFLIRNHGKETIVANRKINHHLGLLVGIAEELTATEEAVSVKGIYKGYLKPPAPILKYLNLEEGDQVYGFYRIVYTSEKPLVVNYSYVPYDIGKLLVDLDINTAKVFTHLELCGYNLSHAEQEISAGICSQEEAGLLEYEAGKSVLVMKRVNYLDNGHPILYEKSIYRGDAYQYSIKLYRKL